MTYFDHSKIIDLRKTKQRSQNEIYNTDTRIPKLMTFDIVPDPGFHSAMMQSSIIKDPSLSIILNFLTND